MTDIRRVVRDRYAEAAAGAASGKPADDNCCGSSCRAGEAVFGAGLYDVSDRNDLPQSALLASLGCGNPTTVADLEQGETVLDLGSGGGIDVLLSAAKVGPTGTAFGLDMTEEMLALALVNKEKSGATNVQFLKGYIEAIPLPAGTIDVVISNCVINLAADKSKVMHEMFRILKPGGRIGISDVVSSDDLDAAQRAERGTYVGCIAGALSFAEYRSELEDAGFSDISIDPTHEVAGEMFSATVKARKPVA